MKNPRAIRQTLLALQESAGCDRFDNRLKRVLTEWKRSLEEWERQASFVSDMVVPSDSLSQQCKDVVHLLSRSLREILAFHYLQRQFFCRHISCQAIVEYCVDFERTFVDANDRLLQCYNDLVLGNRNRAENSAFLVRNSYEACYDLLRRANDRLSHVLQQHLKNRQLVSTVTLFGGNFILWSVSTLYSRYYAIKLPSKLLLFGAVVGASLWSYYSVKYRDPFLTYLEENPSYKELNDFILSL